MWGWGWRGFSPLSAVQTIALGSTHRQAEPPCREKSGSPVGSVRRSECSPGRRDVGRDHTRLPAQGADIRSYCISGGKPDKGLISDNTQALHFTAAPLSGGFHITSSQQQLVLARKEHCLIWKQKVSVQLPLFLSPFYEP